MTLVFCVAGCRAQPTPNAQPVTTFTPERVHWLSTPQAVAWPKRYAAGVKAGSGIQCIPYRESAPSGPISYSISDLGKPGVPSLDDSQLRTIHQIQQYVHSHSLRFAFVNGKLVIFAAIRGPCADFAPGYPVLNGDCRDFYEPGENPRFTHVVFGCMPPRPWVKSERRFADYRFWAQL